MRSGSAWLGIVGAVAAWMVLGPARASGSAGRCGARAVASPITAPATTPEGDAALGEPATRPGPLHAPDPGGDGRWQGPYGFPGRHRFGPYLDLARTGRRPCPPTRAQGDHPRQRWRGSAGTVVIDSLTIGNRTIRHIRAPALAAKDLGADGMLGVDALRDPAPGHGLQGPEVLEARTGAGPKTPPTSTPSWCAAKAAPGQLSPGRDSKVHGVPVLVGRRIPVPTSRSALPPYSSWLTGRGADPPRRLNGRPGLSPPPAAI